MGFALDTRVCVSTVTRAFKRVDALERNDRVATASGDATVECVVFRTGDFPIVRIGWSGGLTPTHPYKTPNSGTWVRPCATPALSRSSASVVIDLVLSNRGAVFLEACPVAAVTLGHGIQEGDVAPHAVYGTDAIVKFFQSEFASSWALGRIDLTGVELEPC